MSRYPGRLLRTGASESVLPKQKACQVQGVSRKFSHTCVDASGCPITK